MTERGPPRLLSECAIRIGEAFPAEDPVARFVTAIAIMSNDVVCASKLLVNLSDEGGDQGSRLMLFRCQASLLHEATKFLVESRRRFPEIDQVIRTLSDEAQALYDDIVEAAHETSEQTQDGWLRTHRDLTFHYKSLHGRRLVVPLLPR